MVDYFWMAVGEMYFFPFGFVFSLNNNPNTVKLSTHTPTWHQYTIFLTKGMISTKYWCTSKIFFYSFIGTMSIYKHQYPLLVGYTSIVDGWISTKNIFSHCVMLDQTWAKHRKINSYPRFPSVTRHSENYLSIKIWINIHLKYI